MTKFKYLKRWQFWIMLIPVVLFFLLKFLVATPLLLLGSLLDLINLAIDKLIELLNKDSIDHSMRKLIKWGFGK